MIDLSTSAALMELVPNKGHVSINLSTSFCKSIANGERAYLAVEVDRLGKQIAFLTAKIYNEKGEVCYKGSHTKIIKDMELTPKL